MLHLNDASLVWGGKFDIDAAYPWIGTYPANHPDPLLAGKPTPHVEHRRGVVIDIRANNDVTAIPRANEAAFIGIVANAGAEAKIHSPNSPTNRHFHVRLLGASYAY